jgi:aminoglycoside phosphotransferase (APT) family kinase protein
MLSPADASLVSRDPAVPGLGILLDDAAMTAVLAQAMSKYRPTAARSTYIRYKPGTSCLVGFEVSVERGEPISVYARAHADGGVKVAKSARREDSTGEPPPGVLAVDAPPMVVFVFPQDHELTALPRLFDAADGPRLLNKAARESGFDSASWTLTRLRYKPERRFVGRAISRDGPVLVKVLRREDAPACIARARAFHDHGPLRIARLLGGYERRGVVAWEWIDGALLGADPTRASQHAEVAGEALARMHAQRPELPVLYAGAALNDLITSAVDAARAISDSGPRAEQVASCLLRHLARWPEELSGLHGDCSPSQVLIADGGAGAALVDLDRAGLGTAPFDVGTFAATLEYRVLLRDLTGSAAKTMTAHLIDGYRRAGGADPQRHLASATALAMLRLAVEPFRGRHPDWQRMLEAGLGRAEALLAGD